MLGPWLSPPGVQTGVESSLQVSKDFISRLRSPKKLESVFEYSEGPSEPSVRWGSSVLALDVWTGSLFVVGGAL